MNGTNGAPMPTAGFLSFNSHPPRLYITAEDADFDEETILHWKEEGFEVTYIPMGEDVKSYAQTIKNLSTNLKLGEHYAIIAYGDAAQTCLDIASKPMARCCALICYYPTAIPHPSQHYPASLNLIVHLAESQNLTTTFSTFNYPSVEEGFAERDLDQYDAVASDLAWSRSLAALKKGFKLDSDLDAVRDRFSALTLLAKDAQAAVASMVDDAHVNYVPTGTGGVGQRALFHFYRDFFIPGSPPSLQIRLISRTSGVDKVVDEMVISFHHTQEVPWILPGIPATGKLVQIPIVSIVTIRGGKLVHEHVYWDQASVLVQIGALDPKFVPKALSAKGVKKLPIIGADEAKKMMNVDSVPSNQFILDW